MEFVTGILARITYDGIKKGKQFVVPNFIGFIVEITNELTKKYTEISPTIITEFFLDEKVKLIIENYRSDLTEINFDELVTNFRKVCDKNNIHVDHAKYLQDFFRILEQKISSNDTIRKTLQMTYLQKLDEKLDTVGNDVAIIKNSMQEIKPSLESLMSSNSKNLTTIKDELLNSVKYCKENFEEQIISFKKRVVYDYEHFPQKPKRPIISNFRKFDGSKYFVIQKFRDLKSGQTKDNIFDYVKTLIFKNLDLIKNTKNKIKEKDDLENLVRQSTLNKKIIANLQKKPKNVKDAEEIQKAIENTFLQEIGLELPIFDGIKRKTELERQIGTEKGILRSIKSVEQKIRNTKTKIDRPGQIKNELAELAKIDFRNITDDKKNEVKAKEDALTEELHDLERTSYNLEAKLKNLTDIVNGYKKQLKEVEKTKSELKKIQTRFEKFSPSVQAKLKLVNETLKEISIMKERLNQKDGFVVEIEDLKLRDKLIPITGDYGCGKSALAHHLFYSLCKENDLIPIFVPLGLLKKHDDQQDHLVDDVFEFIISEYKFNLQKSQFSDKILNGEIIFVFDALDEMSTKLDKDIAQRHLEQIIKISKNCVVFLTSRETYLFEGMRYNLIQYDGLIKILDFDSEQIKKFLHFQLPNNEEKITEILNVVNEKKFNDFAKKPLFLDAIFRNFNELKNYVVINESVILEVLTSEWIQHDTIIEEETDVSKKEKIKTARQKISEILAFAEYRLDGKPIGIEDIKNEVKTELIHYDPEAELRLSEYYKQAIGSTFLIYEANETYRFIIKPIMEYFIARRIVSEINDKKYDSLIVHVNEIKHVEIFDFIRGLIDKEWAIKSHLINEVTRKSTQESKAILVLLNERENRSKEIFDVIRKKGTEPKPKPVSNLIRILHITGNLPPRPNLSNLNLEGVDLSGANLSEASLAYAILNKANLSGVNLRKADLKHAKIVSINLVSADLSSTDLSGADLTNANLSFSNLTEITMNDNTKFYNTKFSYANVKGLPFKRHSFQYCTFFKVNFEGTVLDEVDFRHADLRDARLQGISLIATKFQDANLSHADLSKTILLQTKFNRAVLNHAKIINAVTDRETDFSSAKVFETNFFGTDLSEVLRFNQKFEHLDNVPP